jgi:hypothetical protein
MTMSPPTAHRRATALRWLAVPIVAVTLATGVWAAGGVVTNDFRVSMALTAAWLGLCALACVLVALRFRALRVPVLASYVVAAGAIVGYLGLTTLRDRVVDERVVTGTSTAVAHARNVELLHGVFRSGEHATTGTAAVVRLADGRRFLTLTSFRTSPGPDLRVRLVPGGSDDGGAAGAVDLGALKGNRGDQQYRIPASISLPGRTAVIWCRAFSAPFGSARLG